MPKSKKDTRFDVTDLTEKQNQTQACFIYAFGISDAADALSSNRRKNKPLLPASILLRAFSVELIIKSGILAKGNQPPQNHDLAALYKQLDRNVKLRAAHDFEQYTKTDQQHFISLENFLGTHKEVFNDWRYLHEKKGHIAYPEKLRQAFKVIQSALSLHYPECAQANPYPSLIRRRITKSRATN